jgi:hypothetical protein
MLFCHLFASHLPQYRTCQLYCLCCQTPVTAPALLPWHLLEISLCLPKLLLMQAFAHPSFCSYKLRTCRVQSSSKPWTGFTAPILVESMLYCWCMCQQHLPNPHHPPSHHPCPVSCSPLHVPLKLSLSIRLPWRQQWLMTQMWLWETLLSISL